jgi:hypothetical protein
MPWSQQVVDIQLFASAATGVPAGCCAASEPLEPEMVWLWIDRPCSGQSTQMQHRVLPSAVCSTGNTLNSLVRELTVFCTILP